MGAHRRTRAGWVLIFLFGWAALSVAGDPTSPTGIESTNATPAMATDAGVTAPATNTPSAATNAAPTSQPETNSPSPSEPPDSASTNAPPEINPPPNAEFSPRIVPTTNPMGQPEDLAAHLLVVFNTNDPDSQDLAYYYASQRNIPSERILGLSTSSLEEISRTTFEKTIRTPIISYLTVKSWMVRDAERVPFGSGYLDLVVARHNDIWAIVLMRGIPLKIAPQPSSEPGMERQPGFETNAAAVDSELTVLPIFGLPLGGFVPNIFYDNLPNGIKRVGPDLATKMILVTRLDGPKPSDVRRMIDDSIAAEKGRLAGLAVVDSRGLTDLKSGYTSGDIWLRGARNALVKDGWLVKFDEKPELIPATDPCNQVALYLGWYAGDAMGPWVTPPVRFVPGAIAYHLHSFSANTVRSETSNWVGPLIAHGADATMGMVYEPYLGLTPHEDIFTRRLLAGDYFCEAAWASERGLSWMLTVVGDPLYRPFGLPLNAALAATSMPHTDHDDWLLLQKVQREMLTGEVANTVEGLKAQLEVTGAGPVAQEGLGDLLEKLNQPGAIPAAEEAYQKAAFGFSAPVDRIRLGLKLARLYRENNEETHAEAELGVLRQNYPADAKRFGVGEPTPPAFPIPPNPEPKATP